MRLLILSLAALTAVGCRPLDAGAPETPSFAGGGSVRPTGAYEVGTLRVIDGDTIEIAGEVIRVSNIDAPETGRRAECLAEAQLGGVATSAMGNLLGTDYEQGRTILPKIDREGKDRHGRTLGKVTLVQGGDLGEALIERGVAVRWSGRQADWCSRA